MAYVDGVEIGMGKKLDEALVKQLTGGDQVTARFLYNEFFEYKPEFKLFIAANHKPDIQGVDHGIWRRIHLIPFEVTIPTEEIDRDLPDKILRLLNFSKALDINEISTALAMDKRMIIKTIELLVERKSIDLNLQNKFYIIK